MNRVTALLHVINDASRPQSERDDAIAALTNLEKEGEDRIERRDAKKALDSLQATDTDERDFSDENVFRLLWADGVPDLSVEYLRTLYLPDPATRIEWAWLKFWRDRLGSSSAILRELAECRIKILAEDANTPTDVRRAAADFLTQLKQRTASDPIPEILVPNRERWRTMPHEELHQRAVLHKQSWIDAFYTPR
jgi:uncharacterized protein (UPF0147 family)